MRRIARFGLAALMTGAGVGHFVATDSFRAQVPAWFPAPTATIVISGLLELGFGVALVWGRRLPVVGRALAGFLAVVVVGNVNQAVVGADAFGLESDAARWARVAFQPVLVAWALWSTHAAPRGGDGDPGAPVRGG